jgi:hypothetical protein
MKIQNGVEYLEDKIQVNQSIDLDMMMMVLIMVFMM